MNDYLKKYNVELITIGPVFVGSGKEIGKKEYLFKGTDKVEIVDIQKMYQLMYRKHLAREFEEFLLNNFREDLNTWLRKKSIPITEIMSTLRYELSAGDTIIERGTKLQIMECLKDAYGNAYIPGSTLKGMFRTILLANGIQENPDKYRKHIDNINRSLTVKDSRNRYLKREIGNVEAEAFCTLAKKPDRPMDAVNDVMSGFIVSDSEPIKIDNLVLCQKIEVHPDGSEKRLNLLRECIKPETKIKFTITVDESLYKIGKKKFIEAIKLFNTSYYDYFLSAFKGTDQPRENTLYVGGGTGFVTKTVTYPLFGKKQGTEANTNIFQNTNVPRNHKHELDRRYGVSPHILKCTRYKGKTIQMGQCLMKILE